MSNELALMEEGGELMPQEYHRPASALEVIVRTEIDVQITTAKAYPRQRLSVFFRTAEDMISSDPEIADECTYVLPKKDLEGNYINGPSVRLAEIAASLWGNLSIVSRTIGDDGRFVTAQAIGKDLQTNTNYGVEVQRSILKKNGQTFGADMIQTTASAAQAIARRNITFLIIPRTIIDRLERFAKAVAKGDPKSLPKRTETALAYLEGKGVKRQAVFVALEIENEKSMTLDLLADLKGMCVALKEGHSTVEEMFKIAPAESKKAKDLTEKIQGQVTPAAEPPGTRVERPKPEPPKAAEPRPKAAEPVPVAAPAATEETIPREDGPRAEVEVVGFQGEGDDTRPYAQVVASAVKATNDSMAAEWAGGLPGEKFPENLVLFSSKINSSIYRAGIDAKLDGFKEPIPLTAPAIQAISPHYQANPDSIRIQINELMEKAVARMRKALATKAATRAEDDAFEEGRE